MSDNAARRAHSAEEARWEAQIRTMARHEPRESAPAVIALPPPVRVILPVVNGMKRHDALLIPRTLPAMTGSGGEDLACGKCGSVIASRTDREAARRRHPEGDRLIVRCTCRALNLLSPIPGIRSGYRAGQAVRVHSGSRSPGPRPGPCGVGDDPVSTAPTRKTSKLCYSLLNGSR
jgi:hypothetical protein